MNIKILQHCYTCFMVSLISRKGRLFFSKKLFFISIILLLLSVFLFSAWNVRLNIMRDEEDGRGYVAGIYNSDLNKLQSFINHVPHFSELSHYKKKIADILNDFSFRDAQVRYNVNTSSQILSKIKVPLKSVEVIISMLGNDEDMESCLVKLLAEISSLSLNYANIKKNSAHGSNVAFYMELFFRL